MFDWSTVVDLLFRDAFPAVILLGLMLFVVKSVWPWFSTEYWPSLRDRENRRTVAQENFEKALIEIRNIAESTATMVSQHDQLIRDIAYRLTGSFPPVGAGPAPPPNVSQGSGAGQAAAPTHPIATNQGGNP